MIIAQNQTLPISPQINLLDSLTLKIDAKISNIIEQKALGNYDSSINTVINKSLKKAEKQIKALEDNTMRYAPISDIEKLKAEKPSLLKQSLKNAWANVKPKTSGNISLGYDYGAVPFLNNQSHTVNGFFRTEGRFGAEILGMPLAVNYYYANTKDIPGLNNFFSIHFDQAKFKQNMQEKLNTKLANVNHELTDLYEYRKKGEEKILELKSLSINSSAEMQALLPLDQIKQLDQSFLEQGQSAINQLKDTLSQSDSLLQSSQYQKDQSFQAYNHIKTMVPSEGNKGLDSSITQDSTYRYVSQKYMSYKNKQDSLSSEIEAYQAKLKSAHEKIQASIKIIDDLKKQDPKSMVQSKLTNELGIYLKYVNKFDIGLCYPNHSTFLINGVALRGVNVEIQKDQYYFAFTHGKTINNLLVSNNVLQKNLQGVRNLYNFFDFNNVSESRRITALKVGLGKKEENHIHIGFMSGLGQSSYILNKEEQGVTKVALEHNYVIELDGKYFLSKNNVIDLVYGKSALKLEGASNNNSAYGLQTLDQPNVRTNALMTKFASFIPKTKTKLSFTYRWIDPFFKSYGLGNMRSDNNRFEIKLEQPITNKFKFGISYRKERDNLLSLYYLTTSLQTIGANIHWKPIKRLSISASFNPVIQQVRSKDNGLSINNKNYIASALIAWQSRLRNGSNNITALYNYFRLYDGTQNNVYENYTVSQILELKAFKNELAINYFKTNIADSSNQGNNTILVTNQLSYTFKKLMVSGGIKMSVPAQHPTQFGYKFKINVPLISALSLEAAAEKLVIGDFYNSFSNINQTNFPYYMYGRLNINW
jgi:hypothetical protein